MMKASALRAVNNGSVRPAGVTEVMTKSSQNIKIEYSEEAEKVPEAVEDIASRMHELNPVIRDSLGTMRSLYVTKREDFHISLSGLSRDVKK